MSTKFSQFLKNVKTSFKKKLLTKNGSEGDSFKGSAYKGKGSVNTDTATFNKPRKGGVLGGN